MPKKENEFACRLCGAKPLSNTFDDALICSTEECVMAVEFCPIDKWRLLMQPGYTEEEKNNLIEGYIQWLESNKVAVVLIDQGCKGSFRLGLKDEAIYDLISDYLQSLQTGEAE